MSGIQGKLCMLGHSMTELLTRENYKAVRWSSSRAMDSKYARLCL